MKQKTLYGAAKQKKAITSDNLRRPALTRGEQINMICLVRWLRREK